MADALANLLRDSYKEVADKATILRKAKNDKVQSDRAVANAQHAYEKAQERHRENMRVSARANALAGMLRSVSRNFW